MVPFHSARITRILGLFAAAGITGVLLGQSKTSEHQESQADRQSNASCFHYVVSFFRSFRAWAILKGSVSDSSAGWSKAAPGRYNKNGSI
jgi:hypothetical protein